ncbi:MFS transporter [Pelagovum pacificum]|uniref:MFS transporter n=1 Tax=Pelagovum pacificum TaxID=2588711 RepID=A0A5C5GG68_9RHOB|nr:MFS transporter [Pelagovum pacificum]QQA43641.1 MFS transporter [Pelagovum pacificum]TNY33224.1 MFS transporter [Pelagovum pacificum]
MRTLFAFGSLFLSVMMLQLASGGVGPLDALTGLAGGFSREEVGLLGSAHFLGFFAGCWWAPRLMGSVGASRTFASFAAMGAIGLIGHTLVFDPWAWAVMRIGQGICVAGSFTVIEAWLQARVGNQTRGRTMGAYRIVDMSGALLAQLMIGALADVQVYVAYNILTLFCVAAMLPLTLTKAPAPTTSGAPKLRPQLALIRSPLAVAGVIVAALTSASFRMTGPIYGQEVGLSADQIGLFLAAWIGGGALAQYPAGMLADRYDRRWVLIWLSVASTAGCALTVAISGSGTFAIFASSALFGAVSFPIYSVAASHAHDFAEDDERVELSAALMFWFAVGAIAAPYLTSALIDAYGPSALFAFIGAGHIVLAVFGFFRMRRRAAPEHRTPYVWVPRTSFTIGRLLRRDRDR